MTSKDISHLGNERVELRRLLELDLPRAGVPAMVRAMERLAREVKTTAA